MPDEAESHRLWRVHVPHFEATDDQREALENVGLSMTFDAESGTTVVGGVRAANEDHARACVASPLGIDPSRTFPWLMT